MSDALKEATLLRVRSLPLLVLYGLGVTIGGVIAWLVFWICPKTHSIIVI